MNLICYLSNGFPTIEDSITLSKLYEDGGCDIIEVDLPSHNPYLESELIQSRMKHALEQCNDYDKYMDAIIKMKKGLKKAGFILLSYENTIQEIGVEKFISFCVNNDIKDIILVGLENDVIKNRLIEAGLLVSCYIRFQMDEAEIQSAKTANGFVYMQAKAETGQENPEFKTLADCIKHLRVTGVDRKIYCGVGVATMEDYKMVNDAGSDGAFVGSTILKLYDQPEKLVKTIKSFKAYVE